MQLNSEYAYSNYEEEKQAVINMKNNPKAFFSFGRSRQKTRARIGPLLDSATGHPNPDPDFAANVLSDQYKSAFVQARPEWSVEDVPGFFGSGSG